MVEYLKSAIEIFKLSPRYFMVIGTFDAFLLFGPEKFLARLGLNKFTEDYRTWLGLSFIVSISFVFIYILNEIVTFFGSIINKRKFRKSVIARLRKLTEDEKQILRFYFSNNTRSNVLKVDDGVVQGLVSDGIIYRSVTLGNLLEGFAHNITDFVWEYIHSNQELLAGKTNVWRTDKMESLW